MASLILGDHLVIIVPNVLLCHFNARIVGQKVLIKLVNVVVEIISLFEILRWLLERHLGLGWRRQVKVVAHIKVLGGRLETLWWPILIQLRRHQKGLSCQLGELVVGHHVARAIDVLYLLLLLLQLNVTLSLCDNESITHILRHVHLVVCHHVQRRLLLLAWKWILLPASYLYQVTSM
jgi:hypothetical protein